MGRKKKKTHRQPPLPQRLEVVAKCDTAGCLTAVEKALAAIDNLLIIHGGVGPVNKNDIVTAATAGRLVVGFNVGHQPYIPELCRDQGVEVRLYTIIYRLVDDLRQLADSLRPVETKETVTGRATVIALFKSCRKGIILGCEVREGRLALGDRFRVIAPAGPVYTGIIESLHIEENAVRQAVAGQKAGLKIRDFNKARIGYQVECFRSAGAGPSPWRPVGKVLYR